MMVLLKQLIKEYHFVLVYNGIQSYWTVGFSGVLSSDSGTTMNGRSGGSVASRGDFPLVRLYEQFLQEAKDADDLEALVVVQYHLARLA